ncbi:MAG: hypothetical protein ACLVI9_03260 [Anaerostipes hadrus]
MTGATKSCDAIKEAVRQALNSASSATNTPDSSIFASGKGTTKSPFLIQTATQFKNFAKSVTGSIDYTGYTVKLQIILIFLVLIGINWWKQYKI